MSWDRVHDTHLMHKVPLQVFEQHNPCYTSLLIFSASLQASLTLLLVVSLCITTSALRHHSLKAKSACLQLTFQLSHEIYFLQWFQVSLLRSFCLLLWRDLLKTEQLFSFLCLFWFDQLWRWGFLWMGRKKKKNPLIYYTEASVWYLWLNILCMKKSKTLNLQNSWTSLLKEYN